MADPVVSPVGPPVGASPFLTTHWSLVLSAGQADSPASTDALETLCRTYWYPAYAFVRRQGHDPHNSEDLTQEFFSRLIAKNYLAGLDRTKGRFRSFLLTALKHFLANESDKAKRLKRGGGREFLPLDAQSAESRYALEPADPASPDKLYDRRWALTLLDRALGRVRDEFAADGKAELFAQLRFALTGDRGDASYARTAEKLGTSEGAIKVAVHRLRQRYREALRAEIAQTLQAPEDVDDELRQLFVALAS